MKFLEAIQTVQTLATIIVVVMGLWMRAEFFKFKDQTIQPLIQRFDEQFAEHDMALVEVKGIARGIQASVIDMKSVSAQMSEVISRMRDGINERTLELGRHDERIKGLAERLGRLEQFSRARRNADMES